MIREVHNTRYQRCQRTQSILRKGSKNWHNVILFLTRRYVVTPTSQLVPPAQLVEILFKRAQLLIKSKHTHGIDPCTPLTPPPRPAPYPPQPPSAPDRSVSTYYRQSNIDQCFSGYCYCYCYLLLLLPPDIPIKLPEEKSLFNI